MNKNDIVSIVTLLKFACSVVEACGPCGAVDCDRIQKELCLLSYQMALDDAQRIADETRKKSAKSSPGGTAQYEWQELHSMALDLIKSIAQNAQKWEKYTS